MYSVEGLRLDVETRNYAAAKDTLSPLRYSNIRSLETHDSLGTLATLYGAAFIASWKRATVLSALILAFRR